MKLNIPLMDNNVTQADLQKLIEFLRTSPRLTQSSKVEAFEREWSEWVGVRHSVFLNSGSSANLLTISALKYLKGAGEVIVPTLTWVSDIASVLQAGMTPVFVDINPRNLAMDDEEILKKITPHTKTVFLTHVLGFNGLTQKLLDELRIKNIPLIEDVCESHGATFNGKLLGSYGFASNFSFYYGHHMSTIEGGMVCTDDEEFYETIRMLRSHGMVREIKNPEYRKKQIDKYPDLNPDFIFSYPAYNMRSTEINAVLGQSQLKRLDQNNEIRKKNFALFLELLDRQKYFTDFDTEGSVNYALLLILNKPDDNLRDRVESALRKANVEFRRGGSGGGNQLRQPYLRDIVPDGEWKKFPKVDHLHFYGFYIGNYPSLAEEKIIELCRLVNSI